MLRAMRPKDYRRAKEALDRVGMLGYARTHISDLSGGQQQRLFIARALVQDAKLIFMDEPFAGVDARTEQSIIDLIHNLRERGQTAVIVHHDLRTVKKYFDRVVLLNNTVIASGETGETFTTDAINRCYGGAVVITDAGSGAGGAAEASGVEYNSLVVLAGTGLLGGTCGLLGIFLLLRRRALVGDAISHAALPGIAIAYLLVTLVLGGERSLGALLVGGGVSAAVAMIFFTDCPVGAAHQRGQCHCHFIEFVFWPGGCAARNNPKAARWARSRTAELHLRGQCVPVIERRLSYWGHCVFSVCCRDRVV